VNPVLTFGLMLIFIGGLGVVSYGLKEIYKQDKLLFWMIFIPFLVTLIGLAIEQCLT
jgi:hypothetical protein